MADFKDIKKGDTIECTLEVVDTWRDRSDDDITNIYVVGGSSSSWIHKDCIKNLKILPRPIRVGDTIYHTMEFPGRTLEYTVLYIRGNTAFVDSREGTKTSSFSTAISNLRRVS